MVLRLAASEKHGYPLENPVLATCLCLRNNDRVGWIFFLVKVEDPPEVHVAEEKRRRLGLKNITLRITDAMLEHGDDYTHVYSTAIAGPELYAKLRSIAGSGKLCVLRSMWIGDQGADWHMESVCLGGSGEQRQLLACNLHSNASSHSGAE